MIGAFAVSLSTAYAVRGMLGLKHSLHRGVKQATGFYAMSAALIAVAATIVLLPGSPLGLLAEGVQRLAGVLLPSATVFLLLLCNDKEVLGPWVNGRGTNIIAGIVIGVLVMLSAILMISVVFGKISSGQVIVIMGACVAAAALTGAFFGLRRWSAARRGRADGIEHWVLVLLRLDNRHLRDRGHDAESGQCRARRCRRQAQAGNGHLADHGEPGWPAAVLAGLVLHRWQRVSHLRVSGRQEDPQYRVQSTRLPAPGRERRGRRDRHYRGHRHGRPPGTPGPPGRRHPRRRARTE